MSLHFNFSLPGGILAKEYRPVSSRNQHRSAYHISDFYGSDKYRVKVFDKKRI